MFEPISLIPNVAELDMTTNLVTIKLNIPTNLIEKLDSNYIIVSRNGKCNAIQTQFFLQSDSPFTTQVLKILNHMKVDIRKAKIELLSKEIDGLLSKDDLPF